jgi:dTDP-4-dehydrorhamnose reductase
VSAKQSVNCFIDVYNTPTFADNLADMLDSIIRNNLTGMFHTCGRQSVNRFEFFSLFAHAFNLDHTLLKPVRSGGTLGEIFLLPNSSLNSESSASRLGVTPDSPAEGFLKLKALGGY